MKKALIFFNGDLSSAATVKKYLPTVDIIIGADGGTKFAIEHGIIPDVVIGDLDSLLSEVLSGLPKRTQIIQYPREKDYTDSELAISYALKNGAESIYICGFMGTRFDHMMANLLHLSTVRAEITIIEGDSIIEFIKDCKVLKGRPGDELSIIPLTADCSGISTTGLQYPLSDATLAVGSTRGISNVFVENSISIRVEKGILLVIHRYIY